VVRQAYTHWGWVDKDAFVGDVARWLPPADLEAFDMISVMKMQSHQLYTSGLLTVFKNNDFSRTHWQLAGKQAIIDIVTKVRDEGTGPSPRNSRPSVRTHCSTWRHVSWRVHNYVHAHGISLRVLSLLVQARLLWLVRRTYVCADTWATDETPSPAAACALYACAVQPNNFMSDESITSNPILTSSNATVKFLMGGQAKLHAWEGREVLVRCAARHGLHVHDNTHCMPGLYVHLEEQAKFKRLCVTPPWPNLLLVKPSVFESSMPVPGVGGWRRGLRAAACGLEAKVIMLARSSLTWASPPHSSERSHPHAVAFPSRLPTPGRRVACKLEPGSLHTRSMDVAG
jgi:hypothetical protein